MESIKNVTLDELIKKDKSLHSAGKPGHKRGGKFNGPQRRQAPSGINKDRQAGRPNARGGANMRGQARGALRGGRGALARGGRGAATALRGGRRGGNQGQHAAMQQRRQKAHFSASTHSGSSHQQSARSSAVQKGAARPMAAVPGSAIRGRRQVLAMRGQAIRGRGQVPRPTHRGRVMVLRGRGAAQGLPSRGALVSRRGLLSAGRGKTMRLKPVGDRQVQSTRGRVVPEKRRVILKEMREKVVQSQTAQRTLKVRNIDDKKVTNEDLKKLFEKIGKLKACRFDRNEFGVFTGSATVTYEKPESAREAIKNYNGAYLDEKLLTVELASKPRVTSIRQGSKAIQKTGAVKPQTKGKTLVVGQRRSRAQNDSGKRR